MSAVLLAPHNDDETLFAAFTCLREHPLIIVVLRSQVQEELYGITARQREAETNAAVRALGCEWVQWDYLDDDPPWPVIAARIGELDRAFDHCYAPALHPGWDDHHHRIGEIAARTFTLDRVTHYTTYLADGERQFGVPVDYDPEMVGAKLAALACYQTQVRTPSYRHFARGLAEYTLPNEAAGPSLRRGRMT